jgi:capsular polysaccharide biosynthesis protein
MDLISIAMTVWRHKLVVLPVIVITMLGAVYILKVKAPEYEVSESILLINPPGPPTAQQIAKDPKLAKISTANPYTYFGDLDVVADSVISVVTANSAQLVRQGADPRYTIELSTDTAFPPIIEITGVGSTPGAAIQTAEIVGTAVDNDLRQMQANAGVNSYYMIKAVELTTPKTATTSISGKLRTLIAVLAIGLLLGFVAISVAEATDRRRKDRRSAVAESPQTQPHSRGVAADTMARVARRPTRRDERYAAPPESSVNQWNGSPERPAYRRDRPDDQHRAPQAGRH